MKKKRNYEGTFGELNYGLQTINILNNSIELFGGNLKESILNYGQRYNKIKIVADSPLYKDFDNMSLKIGIHSSIKEIISESIDKDDFTDKIIDLFIDSVLLEIYLKEGYKDKEEGLTDILNKVTYIEVFWFKSINYFIDTESLNTISEEDILKIKQNILKENSGPKTDGFVAFGGDVNNIKDIQEEL